MWRHIIEGPKGPEAGYPGQVMESGNAAAKSPIICFVYICVGKYMSLLGV